MLIYKITNTQNNNFYIGKTTVSLSKRFSQHKCAAKNGKQSHLYNAIRKYGTDSFIIEVLDDKSTSVEQLNELEIDYIASLHPQYNMDSGGTGGCHLSIQQREELSRKAIARNVEKKGKTLEQLYGEEKASDIKRNISVAATGRKLNLSLIEIQKRSERCSINNPGKYRTSESIEKMRSTFKEREVNIGNKNAMRRFPHLHNIIGMKNSKIHTLKNTDTDEIIQITNLAQWARNNNLNPSSVSVWFNSNRSINGWIRLSSSPQPSDQTIF